MFQAFVILLTLELLSALEIDNKEIDNNDVSASTVGNLDTNLRKALLKALKDLENEENQSSETSQNVGDRIIEKAFASSVSILANDKSVIISSTPSSITPKEQTTDKVDVVFQKSEGEHRLTISSYENDTEAEQFITSASNNFAQSRQNQQHTLQNSKSSSPAFNLIDSSLKVSTPAATETTTVTTTTSTEESQAKVDHVQFFSAPLVAAFTVHQDEHGLPNKVEPLFKQAIENQNVTSIQSQKSTGIDDQQLGIQEQYELQLKQKALELQIQRLNANLQQQQQLAFQQLNFQQQQLSQALARSPNQQNNDVSSTQHLRLQQQIGIQKQKALEEELQRRQQQLVLQQQGQLRFNSNQISTTRKPNILINTASGLNSVQQLPTKEPQQFKNIRKPSIISIQPSISFNPLLDAESLPLNAQFVPVKGPVNFLSSPILYPVFQTLSPPPQTLPSLIQPTFFQQQLPLVSTGLQGNRFLRQESGVGNFGNKGFNQQPNSFSIQKSVQPIQVPSLTFVRNSIGPGFSNHLEPVRSQSQNNQFFSSSSSFGPLQFNESNSPNTRNRFFRSNIESTFRTPGNFHGARHDYLGNLIHNTGALRGKPQEDLSLISKVLSLNHSAGNGFRSINKF